MRMIVRRSRTEGCVSDFLLDRHRAGELGPEEEAAMRGHVDQCTQCAERLAGIEREAALFSTSAPPLDVVLAVPRTSNDDLASRRSRVRRGIPLVAGLLAAAAVVMLLLRPRHEPSGEESPRTGIKGASRLALFIQTGEQVRKGVAGDVVAPGDRLQLAATFDAPEHVVVIGRDPRAAVTVYFPEPGQSQRLGPGPELLFPFSVVLDDVVGIETLFTFFCAAPLDVEQARLSIERASSRPPPAPAGCVIEPLTVEKRSR